jgi:hypothetical protein
VVICEDEECGEVGMKDEMYPRPMLKRPGDDGQDAKRRLVEERSEEDF